MSDPDTALASQLRNIERSSGRTVAEWAVVVANAGVEKHGQIVAYLKAEHGLTHGNANTLAHKVRSLSDGGRNPSDSELLDAQYRGEKATLRPIHDEIVLVASSLGDDVTVAVKKTGVSLRRRRQFALIEVPSAKRVRLGLNLRSVETTDRLRPVASGMCTHQLDLTDTSDVDDTLIGWLRTAYNQAS